MKQKNNKKLRVKQFFAVSFSSSICSPLFAKKFFFNKIVLENPKLAYYTLYSSVIKFFSANVVPRKEEKNQFDTKQAFMYTAGV